MGESFVICIDCKEATSDYRSIQCQHCGGDICQSCDLSMHISIDCKFESVVKECDICEKTCASGGNSKDAVWCAPCSSHICDDCTNAHNATNDHLEAVEKEDKRLARKRKYQETEEFIACKKKLQVECDIAKQVHLAIVKSNLAAIEAIEKSTNASEETYLEAVSKLEECDRSDGPPVQSEEPEEGELVVDEESDDEGPLPLEAKVVASSQS